MNVKKRTYSGSKTNDVSERERQNQLISRKAAGEGVVLLKNDDLLPLKTTSCVSLFGNGISRIIKGGTGSGDVNVRHVVSVYEGIKAAGFTVVNGSDVIRFMQEYEDGEADWVKRVKKNVSEAGGSDMIFLTIPASTPRKEIADIRIEQEEVVSSDAVIYVISRIAGEGRDRRTEEGDYYLSTKEKEQLSKLSKLTEKLVIVINAGAQVDLGEFGEKASAIIYLSQPGMEAGHVLADVLCGAVNPSGRLTATWYRQYEDLPNAGTYSYCNRDTEKEKYIEGIYVGYRFCDSFGKKPLYPFGYGLSYTTFSTDHILVTVSADTVCVSCRVTNTGKTAGKEVVQVYAACPQEKQAKELKRLTGYAKTKLLAPGAAETLEIKMDAKSFASFNTQSSAWVVEAGEYGVFLGANAESVFLAGVLSVKKDAVIERVTHISPLTSPLEEINAPREIAAAFEKSWKSQGMAPIEFSPELIKSKRASASPRMKEAQTIAAQMKDDELISMLMGEITKGQDTIKENQLVESGIYVPGAAGETCCKYEEKYGIPAISMADGPAGLRLMMEYDVDDQSGLIYGIGLLTAICGPQFAEEYHRENCTTYYMHATAIPIGTMLAQTWNTKLISEVGQMVGNEMKEYGVSWWLAPGMNIQRNPLCGRNFEYYSEDPVLTGLTAAAMVKGVQRVKGAGTVIKHFAANNQEDNRLFSDSVVSERTLREIYLRGFEIAVKESQPTCLMTSYNLINGVPAANNKDLITDVLRGEWGFDGIVMSDWTTTNQGSAKAYLCAEAGNDLIMPGSYHDVENMKQAILDGKLSRSAMEQCAARLINAVWEITES